VTLIRRSIAGPGALARRARAVPRAPPGRQISLGPQRSKWIGSTCRPRHGCGAPRRLGRRRASGAPHPASSPCGCTPTRSARTCMSGLGAPARRCPTTPGRPQARGRGDTRRTFIANLARVGRVEVRRRARPASWAVDRSGDRCIRGVGLPSPGSVVQMGGGRLLSGPGGLVPPQQPVALKERSPASTAARVAAALNVEARHVPGARNGWPCRHHLFGCRDRWIAAGSYPLATSSRSCRACRRRGPRPSRAARRRSPRW
jgi:hypothetical protein